MKGVFHKLEKIIDKLIPYLVILLLIIIIITFFFKDTKEKYYHEIEILDTIIITFFVIDLIFKFIRVRKIKKFVKLYWLDIIVVFPFYLFIRAIEEIYLLFKISDTIKESQSLAHLGLEAKEITAIEKETAKIVREAEKVGKFSRSRFAVRFLRPITRIPRLLKIIPYYEKSTGKHHPHDKTKKRK